MTVTETERKPVLFSKNDLEQRFLHVSSPCGALKFTSSSGFAGLPTGPWSTGSHSWPHAHCNVVEMCLLFHSLKQYNDSVDLVGPGAVQLSRGRLVRQVGQQRCVVLQLLTGFPGANGVTAVAVPPGIPFFLTSREFLTQVLLSQWNLRRQLICASSKLPSLLRDRISREWLWGQKT